MKRRSDRLLEELERFQRRRPSGERLRKLLETLGASDFPDAESLIRFHEALLFLRAYPHDRRVLRRTESLLRGFAQRVAKLAASGEDLAPFDTPEVSGIVGTTITTDYSYDVVAWLKRRFGRSVRIAWEGFEGTDRLRALWPRFLPLLEEEALEDANVPYREWLRAARRKGHDDLAWLLARIEKLPVPENERAERYEALGLSISWGIGTSAASRTKARWPSRRVFFHDTPMIPRGDVSLKAELAGPPLPVRKLSRREGTAVLEMTRKATALRYREYYGFTYGDAASVRSARPGRGVEIFLLGLERKRRLPLRAGFAGFIVKNGVPVGYVEALAFFDRIEIGFNIYYTFREGESAWIFAKVLKLLHQVLGVSSFSIDPYQIGHENEEAIESGAFWFYRKLGFSSASGKLRALTEREEKKIAADPGYRSSRAVLLRLARSNLLYEVPPTKPGQWDKFHIRNLGLAVQRRMAEEFRGNADRIRRESLQRVGAALGVDLRSWPAAERRAFEDFSLVLSLIRDLPRWTREEKAAVTSIARSKGGPDETRYLRLMQRHARLRQALIKLGSR